MDILNIISAFGLSASAGLNAYIPLLIVALLAKFTNLLALKEPWNALTSWWIIAILLILSLIEFFADKFPAVNHINDVIQTFVRPAAGAVVFAANAKLLTDVSPILSMACGLLIAGGVHAVKSFAVRPAVTASTAGTANVPVSIFEDLVSTIVSLLSIIIPVFIVVLIIITIAWWISRKQARKMPSP